MILVKYAGYLRHWLVYVFHILLIIGSLRCMIIIFSISRHVPIHIYTYISLFCRAGRPCKYILYYLLDSLHISYETIRYLVLDANLQIYKIPVDHSAKFFR